MYRPIFDYVANLIHLAANPKRSAPKPKHRISPFGDRIHTHKHHANGPQRVRVPEFRATPIDRSRYTGEKLRQIRARKTNFKGEPQR